LAASAGTQGECVALASKALSLFIPRSLSLTHTHLISLLFPLSLSHLPARVPGALAASVGTEGGCVALASKALSLSLNHPLSLAVSLSLSLTHTHTLSLKLSPPLTVPPNAVAASAGTEGEG
jgi:hypothetical protein